MFSFIVLEFILFILMTINNSIFLSLLVLLTFMLFIINLQFIFMKSFLLFIILILYLGGIFLIIIYLSTLSYFIYKNIFFSPMIIMFVLPFMVKPQISMNFSEKYISSLNLINTELLFLGVLLIILIFFMGLISILFSNFKEPVRSFYTIN